MKNIGVILRASRPLAKKLEPVNASQAVDLKLGEVNLCNISYQNIDVFFSQAAKPFKKRNLIYLAWLTARLTIFLAPFRNSIPEVRLHEPGTLQGRVALLNVTALQGIKYPRSRSAPDPLEKDFDVVIRLYPPFADEPP